MEGRCRKTDCGLAQKRCGSGAEGEPRVDLSEGLKKKRIKNTINLILLWKSILCFARKIRNTL